MINNIKIIKRKPIKIITGFSFFIVFLIFLSKIFSFKNEYCFLILTTIILIYSIYARIKLNYEKSYSKRKIFGYNLEILNGYLIRSFAHFTIIILLIYFYNSNKFQYVKFEFISITCMCILAICQIIFVKIKWDK